MSFRYRPSQRHGGAAEIAVLVGVLIVSQTVPSDGLRILPMNTLGQTDVFVTNQARKSPTARCSTLRGSCRERVEVRPHFAYSGFIAFNPLLVIVR